MSRALSKTHLIALGVNAIVGAGIFMVPGKLASSLGLLSVGLFFACGLLLNFVALAFARLSKMTDRNGGPYVYASMAFGPRVGFLVGWVAWICAVVSCGAVGNAVGFYIGHFIPGEPTPLLGKGLAGGAILLFGMINYWGIAHGGRTVITLTVLKIIPLFALAFSGLTIAIGGMPKLTADPISFSDISMAIMMALFTCQGFEVVPIIAGETKRPVEVVPTATLLSLWISVFLYCLIQIGITSGPAVGSEKPLADQAVHLWGNVGGNIIALCGLISVIGFVAGTCLGAPRFLSPLCEDGFLPKALAVCHPKFGTPSGAIFLTTGVSSILAVSFEISSLIALSALSVALQYFVSAISLGVLARRRQSKGYPTIIMATLVSVFFLSQVPLASWRTLICVCLAGVALHFGWRFYTREVLAFARTRA